MCDNSALISLPIKEMKTEVAVLYKKRKNTPGFVYINDYLADINEDKVVTISNLASELNVSSLIYDHYGDSCLKGKYFRDNISLYLKQSLTVFKYFAKGPQILIGFSTGGWLALLTAEKLREENVQLVGIILVAPTTDFTYAFQQNNKNYSFYPLILGCPIHIIHGMQDNDVSYQDSLKLMEYLSFEDTILTLVKDGDHHLTRRQDLDLLKRSLREFVLENRRKSSNSHP